jgi:DNA replicative helicase MCM subunit Mcm2 (Cdc46/Mcm family)
MANQQITLPIEFEDVLIARGHEYDQKMIHGDFLYNLMEVNPYLFIKSMRKAAFVILSEIHYDYAFEIRESFRCVIANAVPFKKEITEIISSDVGKLFYDENFVLSVSSQKNFTKNMAWSCGNCGKLTYKESMGFRLPRLKKCMYCNSEDIRESDKDAITETMQEIKMQQKYERLISGRVPKTILGVVYGKDMINKVTAGDICAVTGIVNIMRNPNPAENAVADYYLEIQWVEKKSDDFLIEDDPELEERVKSFIDPIDEDTGYANLIQSIAPSVMGHEIIKEALLLQLVGSDVAFFQDNSRHRGEMQILLCGDSATAKSKLAAYIYQLYGRAVYVSSKVTEAGMIASVKIADKSGHSILEAGAYLLASSETGGLVVCDEMEKTRIEAREALAGCTDERQMVEIHKGAIHQNIQINTASLHISNPKTGDIWDTEKTIKENTGFENWYLSRFCTWIVRDEIDKEKDTAKASHFLKQFDNTIRQYRIKDGNLNEMRRKQSLSYGPNKNIKSVPAMRMYYKYVRTTYHPELNPNSSAANKLIKYYISIRPQGAHAKSLRITMRSLGDLVRFAEASARAHFRNEVTEKDADIAIKLVSSSIASSGFNQFTEDYVPAQKGNNNKKKTIDDLHGPMQGFITAKDLLNNKKAGEIMQGMEIIAHKRQNRFQREIALKIRKFTRIIKAFGLVRCRDCRGEGSVQDGQIRNTCYNCKGVGGEIQSIDYNDISSVLLQYGLNSNDLQEITKLMIKKQIITPDFKAKNRYHFVSGYQKTLLDLAGIEANIEVALQDDDTVVPPKREPKPLDPALKDKINQMKSRVPEALRKKVSKELDSVGEDDDDYGDDGEEEEEEE